ncbi:hypothetical protein BC939DRAFT_468211 [Gamsiella multidivaricata]|uniref:uncharacterized protein n=1 Tax=Gamsiella multidivaricata TaxID=101098 RepID=UPI00222036D0|nr:uncharacterized protein BC939DRAFT_468211 [Gamsiella multidivaricata]KAI7816690.1 hypothetical protein BC939DRAFT_468211 [Gamsiella multidivaricata]
MHLCLGLFAPFYPFLSLLFFFPYLTDPPYLSSPFLNSTGASNIGWISVEEVKVSKLPNSGHEGRANVREQ